MLDTISAFVCHGCGALPDVPEQEQCPEDGLWFVDSASREQYRRDPLLGVALAGKYPLIAVLGEGSFGTVYRARQLAEGRTLREVAVKVVRSGPNMTMDESLARFRREAAAIALLGHPNIVQLFDFGVEHHGQAATFYMVLELVEGRTLYAVREAGEDLPLDRIGSIFGQILQALAAAHDAGIVHRDLKPENVMVTPTRWNPDFVKVLDFGLAKVFSGQETAKLSHTNIAYGTVFTMAPEQVLGIAVDPRTDLYAVGVMLYDFLGDGVPFAHAAGPMVMFQHVHGDVPRLPDRVPPSLRSVVYTALSKRQSTRFADAMAMLDALTQALSDPTFRTPVGDEPPEGLPMPKRQG